MEIINYDTKVETTNKHHFLFPNSIRAIIAGNSGCGKTNLIMNLLLNKGWLNYNRVYLYTNTYDQDKYKLLENFFNMLEKGTKVKIYQRPNRDEIISPSSLDKELNNVVVFDDCMLDKQNIMAEYFTQGRHKNCDIFYLTQSYYQIPKHTIRDNANFVILFKQDKKSIQAIYESLSSGDMDLKEFKHLFYECTKDKYSFLTIDLSSDVKAGKYRK